MINIKTKKEIEVMREGGKILAEILNRLTKRVEPGITTNDLEKLGRELILFFGVRSAFLGYEGYPAVLCTSINEEIVHAVPSERKLQAGDLLKIDTGIFYKNFCVDAAVSILVGGGGDSLELKKKMVAVSREALYRGIAEAKPGNHLGDIGAAIEKYVKEQGLNVIKDLVGHGIGRQLHEEPQIPNYGHAGRGPLLSAGMVLAIEPMIVTGDWRIKEGADGYSFSTKDGGLAAHFEHTIAVTPNGPLTLTG